MSIQVHKNNSTNSTENENKCDFRCDFRCNLDKLINAVKILKGYIYGEFVSLYYLENNIFNNDIKLNFDNINIVLGNYHDSICFVRLLQNVFEIYTNNSNKHNYKIVINYNYNNKNYSETKNLNIYNNILNVDLNYYSYYLDINLLSLNENGLNMINYKNKRKIDFTTILNRIIYKKFSFIDDYCFNIYNNIDKAIELLYDGWIMDDYYLKKETSVLFFWKNRDLVRTHYNDKEKEMMNNDNKCSICTSDFENDDLVINTKCNHNFHWDCNYYRDSRNSFNHILDAEEIIDSDRENDSDIDNDTDNDTDNHNTNHSDSNIASDNENDNEDNSFHQKYKISGMKNWTINFSNKCPICRCEYCI